MQSIIERHQNIALQVSGGRDSLACLYLMRPFWDRLTVYWCNTGDPFPETRDIMAGVRAMVPKFIEVAGYQMDVVNTYGIPSDIVPASHTPVGVLSGDSDGPLIQDRYSCCSRVFMLPMHERMIADDITLVVRGQKTSDRLKAPIRSGAVDLGIEYLFPVEDWDATQIMTYLRAQEVEIPRFYETMDGAPDCMTCSAYWEHGAAQYLRRYHPKHFVIVQRRLDIIKDAISGHIADFNAEVAA